MADTREKILTRLFDILKTVPEFGENVFRNRGELQDDQKPGAVLLDGSEAIVPQTSGMGKGRVRMSPVLMQLRPQVFVALKPRDNVDNLKLDGVDAPVGPEVSSYRVKVARAILNDEKLIGLLGNNGDIELQEVLTDMQTGNTMEGFLQFNFALNYVFDPVQLKKE